MTFAPLPEVPDRRALTTLQTVIFGQQGVCTEPSLFYRLKRAVWVSESTNEVRLDPGSSITFDTFFNILGIGVWHDLCRIDRLLLAVRGQGQVEIRVMQGLSGRSVEQLVREVADLSNASETIIDLSHFLMNAPEGVIWLEVRASDPEQSATLSSARFCTLARPDPDLRLAICPASDTPAAVLSKLAAWCSGSESDGRAELVVAEPPQIGARLRLARDSGFSHALLLDATTIVHAETLNRLLTALRLARRTHLAFGAAAIDPAEKSLLGDHGVIMGPDGKPAAVLAGVDLTNSALMFDMAHELAEFDATLLLPRSDFLAVPLAALPDVIGDDIAQSLVVAPGLSARPISVLTAPGINLHQMPGLVIRRDVFGVPVVGMITLQHLIFPEQGICTEPDLFFHLLGAAAFHEKTRSITLDVGAAALFDTYFNAFSVGKWHDACKLEGLFLAVTGRGQVEIKVFQAVPDRSWEMLVSEVVTLTKVRETLFDLSHYAENSTWGVIYFEARAVGPGVVLTSARFLAPGQIDPNVQLALSITTFKREAQVENTARRLAKYFETAEFAGQMHVFVIDNGDSAEIPEHEKFTRLPNTNLGGAGGFTRGMMEATAAGFSHVLFMDDDASIPMESLHRTYAFLTLTKDPKVAIAGAMINNTDKWRMWENGAIFDRKCRPQFSGTDLRDRGQLMQMEFESGRSMSSKMYGGWWYFAFPVAQVSRHPFPFFVRGDDVNFSLVNEFHIMTLPGVVSFADDFTDKESPLTWYLDLRSHMVHHLTLDKMEIGAVGVAKIGVWFFLRNLAKFQYETIEAILLAWEHVMQGPDYFVKNADAAGPRATIKALTRVEAWKPVANLDLTERRRNWIGQRLRRKLYPLTLNGHFLPFFGRWGNRIVVPPMMRGHLDVVWGASRITYLNSNRDKGYTVTQSKLRGAWASIRLAVVCLRFLAGYSRLRATYRKRYPEITTSTYWRGALSLDTTPLAAVPEPVIPASELVGAPSMSQQAGAAGNVKSSSPAAAE